MKINVFYSGKPDYRNKNIAKLLLVCFVHLSVDIGRLAAVLGKVRARHLPYFLNQAKYQNRSIFIRAFRASVNFIEPAEVFAKRRCMSYSCHYNKIMNHFPQIVHPQYLCYTTPQSFYKYLAYASLALPLRSIELRRHKSNITCPS